MSYGGLYLRESSRKWRAEVTGLAASGAPSPTRELAYVEVTHLFENFLTVL